MPDQSLYSQLSDSGKSAYYNLLERPENSAGGGDVGASILWGSPLYATEDHRIVAGELADILDGSVGALLLYRLINRSDVGLMLALLPAIWLGTLAGDLALKRLTIRSLRPFTLIISTVAAVVLILRTIW